MTHVAVFAVLVIAIRTWRAHTLALSHAHLRRDQLGDDDVELLGSVVLELALLREQSRTSATNAIASARNVRRPSVTSVPRAAAVCSSSAVHPPSGPTTSVTCSGMAVSRLARATPAGEFGSTRMMTGAGKRSPDGSSELKGRGSRIDGTTARPHCFADDTAIRSHRSRRRPRVNAAIEISLRAVTIG